MASQQDNQGQPVPTGGGAPPAGSDVNTQALHTNPSGTPEAAAPTVEDAYDSGNNYQGEASGTASEVKEAPRAPQSKQKTPPPSQPPGGGGGGDGDGDDEEDHMLRMSFLEHLEELRRRIIHALLGVAVAFLLCLIFANDLWRFVQDPAADALRQIGAAPKLAQIAPMEVFSIVWVKLPILAAIFLASPWVLYQVWAFIAPGLYRRERRWAAPFVLCSAGLFILGGVFAYFVAFRYGLVFLLGIGRDINIQPLVSVTEYFDLFVNVMLGIGLVFELPVLIFFLTLLRILTPGFLMRNVRYAILIIVIIAAVVTPTPDVFNLMLFAVPMILLFFLGVFASYLLVLRRENRRFPWKNVLYGVFVALVVLAGVLWLMLTKYGYHVINRWPFLTR